MKRILFLFCLITLLPVALTSQSLPEYVDHQIIVKFSQSAYSKFQSVSPNRPFDLTNNEDIINLFSSLNVIKFERLHPLEEFTELGIQSGMNREFVLYYSEDIKVTDAINLALKNKYIEQAAPNHLYFIKEVPNDQYYSNQWSLPKISMPAAWDLQKGSTSIRIAILDVGFKLDHSDLISKFSTTYKRDETDIIVQVYTNKGYTLISGEDYTTPDNDPIGKGTHGTHVAGISAASTNNSIGIAGVGWNNILVPVRCGFQIIDPFYGSIGMLETDDWIRALDWVRNNSAARVVNMSFGRPYSGGINPTEQTAINNALNAGIVICASSGNSNLNDVGYPAAYPGVIAVGATNENDYRCSPSDWGSGYGSNYGSQLSIVAPGNNIYSTYFDGSGNSTYQYLDGTSMASPHVAGAAALLLSINSNFSPAEIKLLLENSADKVAGMGGQNFHVEYGYGRLNVEQALLNILTFQFVNNIQGSENYGELIIDNDKNNPLPSGGYKSFIEGTTHHARTDELPFILNWYGTTQKVNKWYLNNSNYNLNLEFSAIQTEPFKKDARFETTSPVTLQNVFTEAGLINPNEDNIQFQDPWFYYKDVNNNWFQSNEFKTYSSPLNLYNNALDSYGGVFLNQEIAPNKPYYSVRALQTQDIPLPNIGTRKFYFLNWGGSNVQFQNANALETGVVFKDANAVAEANYKGQGLSNQTDAYNSNSQRKAVRLENSNYLLNVYKSLNHKIWLEQSDNNGQSWYLKSITPIDNDEYSSPAIDYIPQLGGSHPFAAIVHNILRLSIFRENYSGKYYYQGVDVYLSNNATFITPVVATTSSRILIVFNNGLNQSGQEGLGYIYGTLSYTAPSTTFTVTWTDGQTPQYKIIPGTNSASKNISIVADKNTSNVFHIVWEQSNSIKYCKATGSGNSLTFSSVETVSASSPYQSNQYPSISLANGKPIVSWTAGGNMLITQKQIAKENALTVSRTIIRIKGSSVWSDMQIVGNNVNFTNNNSAANTSNENTVIVWSEGSTNPQSKWISRTDGIYSNPSNLSHNGIQTQVIHGSGNDYHNMTALVFNSNQ